MAMLNNPAFQNYNFDINRELKGLEGELSTYLVLERLDDDDENRGVFFVELTSHVVKHADRLIHSMTRDFLNDQGRFLTLAKLPTGCFEKFSNNLLHYELTIPDEDGKPSHLSVDYYRFGNFSFFFS